jgi:hypothetical protein
VRASTESFLQSNPAASFEDVESACFPGRDGELDCRALSPRHLEACATRTAQILVEGEYNGLLKPGFHYFAVKSDFSNLQDVLDGIGDETRRLEVVERAYRDIVQSGMGSYRMFVGFLDGLANAVQLADKPQLHSRFPSVGVAARLAILRVHMKLQSLAIVVIWSVIAGIRRLGQFFGYRIDSNEIIGAARGILRFGR